MQNAVTLKVDLSKSFDRVSWLYIILLLIHVGFNNSFVSWIMSCINTSSLSILVNRLTSPFFKPQRGICHCFPLSPLLFLLLEKGLNRLIHKEIELRNLKGILVSPQFSPTHILFRLYSHFLSRNIEVYIASLISS
jgi:hypothetical protein